MPPEFHVPEPADVESISSRVLALRAENSEMWQQRLKIRDLMDGGPAGISRIVGRDVTKDEEDIPAVNMILMANTRLGQKLGKMPDTKIEPPAHIDSDRSKRYAEKRVRIVNTYDDLCRLELQLPQGGRWLPGYGFIPMTIVQRKDINGDPYPHAAIRDPFNCFPGQWTVDQQPADIAFIRRTTHEALARQFPEHATKIMEDAPEEAHTARGTMGNVIYEDATAKKAMTTAASWANQSGTGLDVYEYWDSRGTWYVVPDKKLLLAFVPNPLKSDPAFHVAKRFAFNKLNGQYDHVVGLMAAIARLNVLSVIAAEDSVFAETNIAGDMLDGDYERGHRAVNRLTPGSKVQKMNERVPFEVFRQIDRLEQQLRQGASYPQTEDSDSPISFVTGQGIAELRSALDQEEREYQKVLRWLLQDIDAKRLEWANTLYSDRTFNMEGVTQGGVYAETYKPSTHIDGNYRTRRVYGIMAGWDEPNKIAGGLNLLQAEVIDMATMRENLDGLEDITKIEERVRNEKVERSLFAGLQARAEQGDPNVLKALVEMLPDSDMKELFREQYVKPMEEQMEQQQGGGPGGPGGGGSPAEAPDVQTVLQRLGASGDSALGVQNVGTVGGG